MDSATTWRELFENWPPSIPRKGVVVTKFGENVPFVMYLLRPGMILLERDKPDTIGGRKVMLAYDQIAAVKIVDPLELIRFQAFGFAPPAG
jgi:hypothetical protein